MKNHIVTFLFIVLVCLSGCSNEQQIDKEAYNGLIAAMVNTNEQLLEINYELIIDINGISSTLSFMMHDPQSRKTAMNALPINQKVKSISNETDDFLLYQINKLTEKEEGKKWFDKNSNSQFTEYRPFSEMENADSRKWTTKLLGVDTKKSNYSSDYLRNLLISYRNDLILTVADSMKNDKNQVITIRANHLRDYETFKKYLVLAKHPWKYDLLRIYSILSYSELVYFKGEAVKWNRKMFHNQPLIGVISSLSSIRNNIRIAQRAAGKIILSTIDKPLKPLHEYQK